jgi:hypothetical protein
VDPFCRPALPVCGERRTKGLGQNDVRGRRHIGREDSAMGSETAVLGGNVPAMVVELAEKAVGCAEEAEADVVSRQGGAAMHVSEAWDYMPGEDSCPFEPKASDWGWFEGRMVALDYSTPAWDADEPTSA